MKRAFYELAEILHLITLSVDMVGMDSKKSTSRKIVDAHPHQGHEGNCWLIHCHLLISCIPSTK